MHTADPTAGLVVRGATKIYGSTNALVDVDLEIRPGEVVALLGENGAGKSTLASVIAGLTVPTAGSMTWRGESYTPTQPGDAIALGIGLIHQELRLLPDLSVAENVMIGRWPTRGGFLDAKAMRAAAEKQLSRLGFHGSMDQLVRELNVAGQQQVEIAKALMLDAKLLILDEPTAALGQAETDALFARVKALRDEGVSFVYVSHRLAEIAEIADRIVVLRDGRKIAEHNHGQVAPNQLVEEMVGRSVDRLFPDIPAPTQDVVIEVNNLSGKRQRFTDISFSVHAGEIFGIAGIVGAGRTELVRAICGADTPVSGEVKVLGKPIALGHPRDGIAAGIVLVPEDRKQQGLIVGDTIEDNIALANLDALTKLGWISGRAVRSKAKAAVTSMGVKGAVGNAVSSLSGGNQQKVVIAKWLARNPRVVILDEPTRGIDVGARAAIYEVIAALAANGSAVIVVSSDLEEVLGLSHRVMVLARGESQGILAADESSAERVIALATA